MLDMNKHIVKDNDDKPFHSNGYARAANGDNLGASSDVTFDRRRQIDANRRVVAGYQRSAIGSSYNDTLRAKSVVGDNLTRLSQNRNQNSGSTQPRQRMSGIQKAAPPAPIRKYNPYA